MLVKNIKKSIVAVLFSTFFYAGLSEAETRYVSDDFEVMVRSGSSVKNKIITTLRSGAVVTVLRENSGNGHSQVRTANGDVGYLLTRYITKSPSAKSKLAVLQNQLTQLKSDPTKVQSLMAKAQDENRQLITQNVELTEKLQEVEARIANIEEVSGDVVQVATKNLQLEAEVRNLMLQLEDMRIQNDALKDNSKEIRMLIGGGLIVFGVFLGWVLSISGRRNRGSWGA